MAIQVLTSDANLGSAGATASAMDLLTKNTLTTAGVVVGSGAAMAGATLLTVALPAQMLGAVAISGGLIYAGDRQHKGLSINPFAKSDKADATPSTPVEEAPASEPVADTAAA